MDKRDTGQPPSRKAIGAISLGAPLVMIFSIALLQSPHMSGIQALFTPSTNASPKAQAHPDPFRNAVNRAMRAAILTQSANTMDEWAIVKGHWQAAIALMQAVPTSSDKQSLAQQKIIEYGRNLAYAQQKLETSPQKPKVGEQPPQPLNSPETTVQAAISDTAPPQPKRSPAVVSDPVLASQSSLPPRNWMMIATEAESQIYIDAESVSRNLPYVEFWQRLYGDKAGKAVLLQDQLLRANCQTHQFQLKELITYQTGRTKHEHPKTMGTADSDSAQHRVISNICGQ